MTARYARFEINVLDYLRTADKVVIHGLLPVKNFLDDDLIANANIITSFDYGDGTSDVLDFVAVLTDKGRQFLTDWQNEDSDKLTY